MTGATDEDVIAYVDGCLDGAARDEFEARLKREPVLAQKVAAHRWMARQIVAAFGAPPGEEVDQAELARLGLSARNVVDITRQKPRRTMRRSVFGAILGGAIAASLAAGVLLDRSFGGPGDGLLRTGLEGGMFAQASLADSLSARLSGEPGAVRVGLTFRTARTICRTFSTDQGLSGLGCRDAGRWAVPIVVAPRHAASSGQGEYHLAGGSVAPSVMAEVDNRIVGDPLTPAEEKVLMERGWRSAR